MNPTRDEILEALRAVPGVYNSEDIHFSKSVDDRNRTIIYLTQGGIMLERYTNPATLAEAVAALTPPAEPVKPAYDWVAGLRGAKTRAEYIFFERQNGTRVEFNFGADGDMLSAYLEGQDLATPTTEPEVLATLRMCRVEVK